jgi:glycine hydroxymethyltransferase
MAQIAAESLALGRKLFDAEFVDLRPLGGEMAAKAVIGGLTKPGDVVFETPGYFGGHQVATRLTQGNLWADVIKVEYMPFDPVEKMPDLPQLEEEAKKKRPKVIIMGHSQMVFPEPVKEVKEIARGVGSYLAYDASHVMGLIADKVFPNPLDGGADVVFGSVHKTLPGPQGGIIFTRDQEVYKKVRPALYPALVTNHHLNRVIALAVCFLEMLEFGQAYGEQVIKNSQALGRALSEAGIPVLFEERSYSQTHIVLVDVSSFGDGKEVALRLEQANIVCGGTSLPRDREKGTRSGLRLGTQELTRLGMKEEEMATIAGFFKRVIVEKEQPEDVAGDVGDFVSRFQEITYAFEDGASPFEFPPER